MLIRGYIRKVSDGTPVPDGTEVAFRRHVDDSLLSTVTTVGGMYELVLDGSPGPYYVRAAIADEVHISSSKVVGMSGPVDIGNIPLYFRLWTDGYIVGVLEQMSVFATGAAMQVTVRSGATLVKGVLYDQPGQATLTIDAADTQGRIDTVVIETMVPGSGVDVEGRTRLVVKKGTPSETPVAPALTQLINGIWEHPLANVIVDPSVSSIASNKVTDRRVQSNVQIGNGYISTAMLADDSVTAAKMAPNSVAAAEIADGAVGTAEIANLAVTRAKIAASAVGSAEIADNAVTSAKIAAKTIVAGDIADRTIMYSQIELGGLLGNLLADATIDETKLSTAVQGKINAADYNHATEAPTAYINLDSTTPSTVATTSMTCAAGTWVFLMRYEGQFAMQSMGTDGAAQITLAPSSLVSSHAVQNVEADSTVSTNFSMVRVNRVVLSASSVITFNAQAAKLTGSNGKISGSIGLHGIRIA